MVTNHLVSNRKFDGNPDIAIFNFSVVGAWSEISTASMILVAFEAGKQTMGTETRNTYRQVMRRFSGFLDANATGNGTLLRSIDESTIEMYKVWRHDAMKDLKQARGGSSVALDIAVLHGMFRFAVEKKLMAQKPIELKNESKPGANPKNGARAFSADELKKLRAAAGVAPRTDRQRKLNKLTGGDLFVFLVLRWTGLRRSDAIKLRWQDVHFDRGQNGEIEVLTQKRGKIAIIPLAPELREALEQQHAARNPQRGDLVLLNPESGEPYSSRRRLYEQCLALGRSAGVERVTPHCFRDTFACDRATGAIVSLHNGPAERQILTLKTGPSA